MINATTKQERLRWLARVHQGHLDRWLDRISTGKLEGTALANAHDLIRIHRIHATMPAEPTQTDMWGEC